MMNPLLRLISWKGLPVFFALLVLSGCTSLTVNMGPYYSPVTCSLSVTDERPDLRTVVGSDIDFTFSPPPAEVLRSKLCRSSVVSSYLARNTMAVRLSRMEMDKSGFVGTTKLMTIEGSVETGLQRLAIVSRGTLGAEGLPPTWWPMLVNAALDDFVKQVEEKINPR